MAFENLTPGASIWRASGITHILFSEERLRELRQPVPVPKANGPQARAPAPPAPKTQPTRQPERQPMPKTAPVWRPTPIENWPPVWQEQLGKTKPAKVAWTYWNLGPDLLAAGQTQLTGEVAEKRKKRSMFLRRVLADLANPPGTHTFWPAHLDIGEKTQAQPDLFWSGLDFLGCRGVFIMGSRAAWPLLNRKGLKPLTQLLEKGHIVWILRDIDDFPESEYERMLAYVRSSLANTILR